MADKWLLKVHQQLGDALRIPTMPWPDPYAHGHEATARAIHASYCALRFKVMDAIAELTASRCALTDLLSTQQAPVAYLYVDEGRLKLAQTDPPPDGSFPVFREPAASGALATDAATVNPARTDDGQMNKDKQQ